MAVRPVCVIAHASEMVCTNGVSIVTSLRLAGVIPVDAANLPEETERMVTGDGYRTLFVTKIDVSGDFLGYR